MDKVTLKNVVGFHMKTFHMNTADLNAMFKELPSGEVSKSDMDRITNRIARQRKALEDLEEQLTSSVTK
ncbi:hypothetical protein [Vibrio owensii]|uniref:hypothetical protein n=1 Tax=Vibrio owensii TaxID=696485 RepID=UPI0018F10F28|nr:hypothetical protein [Vibrio owensii]